jgi:hypothetical protein
MASAASVDVGKPSDHWVLEFDWNGFRADGDVPNPKIAAARMRDELEHKMALAKL